MDKVIVVGGGAAGILAACFAAKNAHDVTLYERNAKLGKKLFITGKGRCNVTNAADMDEFFENIARNKKFLYSALYGFTNQDLQDLLVSLGVPLKTERGNRVFPASDKSSDILQALGKLIKQCGVTVCLESRVTSLLLGDGCVQGVVVNGHKQYAKSVIVATGGVSYPLTGSTGDGYDFAKSAGLELVPPTPSLVAMITKQKWVREVMGLTLKNILLTVTNGKKQVFSQQGELLFTHFGVSGPLVLSASAHVDINKPVALAIDLKPALDEQTLDARILRDFEKFANKQFSNALGDLLPSGLIEIVVHLCQIPPAKQVNGITKPERKRLAALLKHLPLDVVALRPVEEAIITRGGVKVSQINPSTMQAKSVQGLYFAGEVLDVDGYTGGFNLQIAFSTGVLAGRSV